MTREWQNVGEAPRICFAIGPHPAAQDEGNEMHPKKLVRIAVAVMTATIVLSPTVAAAGGSAHYRTPAITERWVQAWARYRSPTAEEAVQARHAAFAKLGSRSDTSARLVEIVASDGFRWADAGVGAGAALGSVLAALGAVVVIRSSRLTPRRGAGQS